MKKEFEILNLAALARRLLKSRHWFYQRLNGNLVNGKRAAFSPEDRERIAAALRGIQAEVGELAAGFEDVKKVEK